MLWTLNWIVHTFTQTYRHAQLAKTVKLEIILSFTTKISQVTE